MLGTVLGYILTAWAAAGIVGPILITVSHSAAIFLIFSGIIIFALVVGLHLKHKMVSKLAIS